MWCLVWLLLSVIATYAWLRCSPQGALFITLCLSCLFLFWGALLNQLLLTSQLLSVAGPILGCLALVKRNSRLSIQTHLLPYLPWLGFIVGLACLFSINQTVSSIDEPIYWAIIGKYLFLFDHLPISDDLILSKHLRYLPGLGLLHYHFYQLADHYTLQLAFIVQSVLLLSTLLLCIRNPRQHAQIYLFLIAFFALHLFFGTILARLDVDYLLAAVFLMILWHLLTTKPLTLPLEQRCAIFILPLIKIPGFYFALVALLLYYSIYKHQSAAFKGAALSMLLSLLIFNQCIWQHYADIQQLGHFRSPITWQELKLAFSHHSVMQHAFFIFLKEMCLGAADRWNIPYLFWYALLGYLIFQKGQGERLYDQLPSQFFVLLAGAFLLYGIQLYGLQLFAFGLGSTRQETVSLARYLNMLFVPMLLAPLLFTLQKTAWFNRRQVALFYFTGLISAMALVAFHAHHNQKLQPNYRFASKLATQVAPLLQTLPRSQFFLLTAYGRDNIAWQLNYHLLDLQHHYQSFEPLMDGYTQQLIRKSDYLLIYQHPDCPLKNGLYRIDHKHAPKAYCSPAAPEEGLTLITPIETIN